MEPTVVKTEDNGSFENIRLTLHFPHFVKIERVRHFIRETFVLVLCIIVIDGLNFICPCNIELQKDLNEAEEVKSTASLIQHLSFEIGCRMITHGRQ